MLRVGGRDGRRLATVCSFRSGSCPINSAKLKFSGGIVVIPVSNVTCSPVSTPPETCTGAGVTVTVSPNIVRGQQPAGQIWLLNQLAGTVNTDGSINVS